jgi:putative pyrroloquinoline-quinone binding quinoprotein
MIRLLALASTLCGLVLASTTLFTDARAYAAGGDLLWQDRFNLAGGQAFATAVASSHGRVVAVGGAQNGAGNSVFVVRAYDPKRGTLLWEDRVDPQGGNDQATAVVMDDQRVVVLGHGVDAMGNNRTLIRAYVAGTGDLAWADHGPAAALALGDSHIVAAGLVVDASGNRRVLVRAFAKKTGALAWEDEWVAPFGHEWAGPGSRTVAIEDGKAFVAATAGEIPFPDGRFICIVRSYKVATGTLLWQSSEFSPGQCRANAIATDGRRVVIAENGGGANLFDFQVESFDAATGELLWHDGENHTGFADGAVAVDTEHRVAFVTGVEYRFFAPNPGPSTRGLLVVRAYDTETGVLRWEDRFPLPPEPGCECIGLDVVAVKEQLFVVGRRSTGVWLVRAYDVHSGGLLWHDEFAPATALNSRPTAVASDHGQVFVAGSALNANGNLDFILRTYEAK